MQRYDRYNGVEELLPFAKGAVSAKFHDFDSNGEPPLIDYRKVVDIVKKSGLQGYIGMEYEGSRNQGNKDSRDESFT